VGGSMILAEFDRQVVRSPTWLLTLESSQPTVSKTVPPSQAGSSSEGAENVWLPGERHEGLLSCAARLRSYGHCEETIRNALLAMNEYECSPPLDIDEVLGIATWIAGKPPGRSSPPVVKQEPRFYTLAELQALPPPEWLIEGVLPAGGLCEVHGAPGHGKSFLALDWAMRIATGIPWCGRPVKEGPVVYVAAEDFFGLGGRTRSWELANVVAEDAPLIWHDGPIQLLDEGEVDSFLEMVARLPEPPAFIVFDTLARCFAGGEENSAADMTRAIAAVDRIRRVTGAAVLLLHHTRKNDQTERGSGVLRGAADAMISVRQKGDCVTMSCVKLRGAGDFDPIQLRRIVVEKSCVLEPVAGVVEAESSTTLNSDHNVLLDLLVDGPLRSMEWKRRSRLSKSTFHRRRMDLVEGALVVCEDSLYRLTEAGEEARRFHGSSLVPIGSRK
jgi:hypothetical protein